MERHALAAGSSVLLCNTLFGGSSHGVVHAVAESAYIPMLIDKQVYGVHLQGGETVLDPIARN